MGACSARPLPKDGVKPGAKRKASKQEKANSRVIPAAVVAQEMQSSRAQASKASPRHTEDCEQAASPVDHCSEKDDWQAHGQTYHVCHDDASTRVPSSEDLAHGHRLYTAHAPPLTASSPSVSMAVEPIGAEPSSLDSKHSLTDGTQPPCGGDIQESLSRPTLQPCQMEVIAAAEQLLPGKTMSSWQREWCTAKTVDIYLNGRHGDVGKGAEILAKALAWRKEHEEILTGRRVPNWAGDMRILTRAETGHPVMYMCTKNQACGPKTIDVTEHFAVVLETAVQSLQHDATGMIAVVDLHGFRLSQHLSPRPAMALAQMLQQPYRDRLHMGIIVDAPSTFHSLWKLFSSAVPETTRKKIQFLTKDEATEHFAQLLGPAAADKVVSVMNSNRMDGSAPNMVLPSELQSSIDDTKHVRLPTLPLSGQSRSESGGFLKETCLSKESDRPIQAEHAWHVVSL